MEAYLDNAATTKALPSVMDIMMKAMSQDYGNPSSMHTKGMDAEQYIKEAAELIASSLKAEPKEIIFTSGGTEANNLALIGCAQAAKRSGKHIITTAFEHPSVHEPLLYLKAQGYELSILPVDRFGRVNQEQLVSMVREDTILVSVMYVNNEIGVVQDIAGLARAIKEKNKNALFHTDAVQAYGKYVICPKKEGIDLLSASGHKLHGPKGSGFLYVKDCVKIKPVVFGGGQQKGRRSGTENVPAIAGFGAAVKEYYKGHEDRTENLYSLKKQLIEGILEIEGVVINAIDLSESDRMEEQIKRTAPHIVSVSFEGISKSEVLLHALAEKNVFVSSGSACSSNHPGISGSLRAIGVRDDLLNATLRFSFSLYTKKEEIEYAVQTIKELLPQLRKFRKH